MKRLILLMLCLSGVEMDVLSQGCCSGGGSNPLAGGNVSGLLKKGEMDIMFSQTFSHSGTFYKGSEKTEPYFEKTQSSYQFTRIDVGLSDKVNLSTALGYYSSRKIFEFKNEVLNEQKILMAMGMGDLMILPRFQLWRKNSNRIGKEIDFGAGFKIPLGICNDSNFVGYAKFLNTSGPTPYIDSLEIWHTSPPLIQTTTGSLDMITSLFYMQNGSGYNVFVNLLYIHRGWNSLGIKFGDYASLGVFGGRKIGPVHAMLQLKAEWYGSIKTHDQIDYLAVYNIDKSSTGAQILYFSPQLSYNFNSMKFFATGDLPLWQNVKGIQAGLPYQFTLGTGFKFASKDKKMNCLPADTQLNLKGLNGQLSFPVGGSCSMCKERIENLAKSYPGVQSATWNPALETLYILTSGATFDEAGLQSLLAKNGHDAGVFKAKNKVYQALPECCHYRKEK